MSGTSTPNKSITKKPKSDPESRRYPTPLVPEKWLPHWGVLLLLLLLAAVIYLPHLSGEFVWDGRIEIRDNPRLHDLSDPWSLMMEGAQLPPRPLPYLSFALNFAIFGDDPYWFRLVNLAIHIANGCLIFWLLEQLCRKQSDSHVVADNARLLAASVAILWTIHPIATQVVSYVYQRQESLTALLMLVCLAAYLKFRDAPERKLWLLASLTTCGLAMTCKETAIVTPILIMTIDYFFFPAATIGAALASRWKTYAGFLATASILIGIMLLKKTTYAELETLQATPFQYLLNQADAIVHYLQITFAPQHVALNYQHEDYSLSDVWLHLTLIAGLLALTAWGTAKRRAIGFVGCWFFLNLAPTSSVLPLVQPIQDYRIYLAIISLLFLPCCGLLWCFRMPSLFGVGRISYAAVWLAVVAAATWQSSAFAAVFQSEGSVWRSTCEACPENSYAIQMLTFCMLEEHRNQELIEYLLRRDAEQNRHIDRAIKSSLVTSLQKSGRIQDAIRYADLLAVRDDLQPTDYSVLGNAYRDHDSTKALHFLERALKETPESSEVLNNLGTIYARTDPEKGADYLRRAIQADASNPSAHLNLGNALARMNQFDAAIASYDATLALDPGNRTAQQNRQIVAQMRNKRQTAD